MLALFKESAHALLLVRALEAGAEGLLLDHDGAVDIDLKAVVDSLLGRAHRDGRVGRDLTGELFRRGVELVERVNGVDKADAQRFVRLDVAGATKDFSPAPRTMTQRTVSISIASSAASRSARTWELSALSAFSRSMMR